MGKGNPHPYKFTLEEQSRGGKESAIKRMRTNELTEFLSKYIESNEEDIGGVSMKRDFKELSANQRLQFLMAYMPYEKPKLSATEQEIVQTLKVMSEEDKEQKLLELKAITDKIPTNNG
jgi:hypothetical protein